MSKDNKKLTTEEFIKRAISVHGNKYDYSKVKYKNNHSKVIIVCHKHGEFKQTPHSHLQGKRCNKCVGNKKLTTEEFIKRAISVHGNKYDYSKVKYKNNLILVIIICHKHGEFKQEPGSHLQGRGCNKCGIEKSNNYNNKPKLTTEQFIKKAILVHGNKYNYNKIIYNHSKKKVIIICHKHGEFEQTPNSHLLGKGCNKCNESHGEKLIRKYLEEANIKFIQEKIFKNLDSINNGLLRFDFFLPDFNMCIEYDGQQHFNKKYFEKYYKNNKYETLKKNDRKKSRYCKKHEIKLIRIPYYRYNKIFEILNDVVK